MIDAITKALETQNELLRAQLQILVDIRGSLAKLGNGVGDTAIIETESTPPSLQLDNFDI